MAIEQLPSTGWTPGTKPPAATSAPLAPGAVVSAASEPAQSGPETVETPVAYDGILLASFGGPEGQDDVIPFLRNVTRGRGIPDERLEEVAVHYRHHGGVSPINEQNRELKAALEVELKRRGIDLPVFWGNRNWVPYTPDALLEAKEAGCTKLIAIATSAYSSYSSCRQYREDFADALEATGLQSEMQIDKVRQFFDHPGFVTPFIDGLRDDLLSLAAEHPELDLANEVEVLFTTHSVPTSDAAKSGPAERGFGEGGAYAAQHLAVAGVVVEAVLEELKGEAGIALKTEEHSRVPESLSWQLVYQSRSGPPSQPWLEPDINDVIDELEARSAVVVVPIGFVTDHVEVVWDLDTEAKETAENKGLAFVRVATSGSDDRFIGALADLVQEAVTPGFERRAVIDLPGTLENEKRTGDCGLECCLVRTPEGTFA